MDLYVDRISYPVTNLGPGRRIGMWVQGCGMGCPGCLSPGLFERHEQARISVADVVEKITSLADAYDGLTISGGEPFDQAEALAELARKLRAATRLDFFVYSGYRIETLRTASDATRELLSEIDVLMDGPFAQNVSNRKLWRGSDNQRMHLLSQRAAKYECFRNAEYEGARQLHIEVTREGVLHVVGIPERGFVEAFRARAAASGLELKEGRHASEDLPESEM